MPQLQTFTCDIAGCDAHHTEQAPGDGAMGWGQLKGVRVDGIIDPLLCPRHLGLVAEFVDTVLGAEAK